MTISRIMREERLFNHRDRPRHPRKPRAVPMLEAKGIHQMLALDITLAPSHIKG
jgi:hypothetical protein